MGFTLERKYIKINLPLTEETHRSGNGEGVWVIVDSDTLRDYDRGRIGGHYSGILDNDSIYYPGLVCGAIIPFEMRGGCRPVADFDFLSKLPSKLTPAGKAAVLQKISEHHKKNKSE